MIDFVLNSFTGIFAYTVKFFVGFMLLIFILETVDENIMRRKEKKR